MDDLLDGRTEVPSLGQLRWEVTYPDHVPSNRGLGWPTPVELELAFADNVALAAA